MPASTVNTGFQHQRSFGALIRAAGRYEYYIGALKVLALCDNPVDFLRRYLFGLGDYPVEVFVRSPIGKVRLTAFIPEDILTINEIFFWGDYGDVRTDHVIVDFGSNVGVSALFFLSRNADSVVYCHEPLPQNLTRLRQNLRAFEGRYSLTEAAVTEADGTVSFGWEPTGRYGGIGYESPHTLELPAVDSNRRLAEILDEHGEIDLLKIDIERCEEEITTRIPLDIARRIRRLAIEYRFTRNPLPETHVMHYRRPITTLTRIER